MRAASPWRARTSDASATEVGSTRSNSPSTDLSSAFELSADRRAEPIHDVVALADDHAMPERAELAEHVDVHGQRERGATVASPQRDVDLHLHEPVDGRIAPPGARAKSLRRERFEHLDRERELDLEGADLLGDDRAVQLAVLDRPHVFR